MQAGARPGPGSRPRHLPPEPAHVQHPEALRRHWLRDTTPRWPRPPRRWPRNAPGRPPADRRRWHQRQGRSVSIQLDDERRRAARLTRAATQGPPTGVQQPHAACPQDNRWHGTTINDSRAASPAVHLPSCW